MSVSRPTRVEIDLAALRHNFQEVQRTVGDGCESLAVVKADAYGHGAVPISRRAVESGAELKGIIVEKPLARTLKEADTLVRIAKAMNIPTARGTRQSAYLNSNK